MSKALPFQQPTHETRGTTSGKNKSEASFQQNPSRKAGKTSSKKGPGKLGFTQKPSPGKAKASTGGAAPFDQPNHGGSAAMPKYADRTKVVQKKMTGERRKQPQVAPKMTSLDSIKSYRKQKYGI